MCLLCMPGADPADDAVPRLHVLRLLALAERPDALPPDAALRLCREIMDMIGPAASQPRCDLVIPAEG